MAVYVWQQELDPDFPLAVLEYATQGDRDRMHWHDHLEIALVLDGRGAFLFGRRVLPAEAGDVFFIDNSQPHVAVADPGPAGAQAGAAAGCTPGARSGGRAAGRTRQERGRRSDVLQEHGPAAERAANWHPEAPGAESGASAGRCVRPGQVHRPDPAGAVAPAGPASPTDATPLRLLLVLFRPELIAGPGCRELDLEYLAPFRVDERTASARICGGTALAAGLATTLHELRGAWERHDPAERHLLDATLRRALGLVIRDRGTGSADAAARAAADRREQIRPVLAYVDRHSRESITLDDVAEVVHVSPSRVRHVFKDVTGVSFKEYVTHVRVAEAKRLLLGTDLSVAEIARAVSYTNLHQFYRVFYRSCAMSPGEYRRYYTPAGGDREPDGWLADPIVPAAGPGPGGPDR